MPEPLPSSSSQHMILAAGPYCLRDSLDYSPLESLLEHAARARPSVLILLGPFVDANNSKVQAGEPALPGESEPCSFEEVYARLVLPLLAKLLAPLRPATEVLVVPSLDEVLCFHPLPQVPLDLALSGHSPPPGSPVDRLRAMGVRFAPNPAHLLINGARVSLTSADALSPVLRELVLKHEGKKIEEALRLLLQQRGLFPVVPRDPAQVSECRAAALDFPDRQVPAICIFPSAMGVPTGMVVDSTLFVNPGQLCKPAALGNFAEVWIAPGGSSLRDRCRVDIHKLG